MPKLIDDGTLDTVILCECGQEHRFHFEPSFEADSEDDTAAEYDAFVDECIADVANSCECRETPTGPEEGDITTSDHRKFYQDGRLVLDYTDESGAAYSKGKALGTFASMEQALKAYMIHEQFWPNVWFISDHGNAHLMNLDE